MRRKGRFLAAVGVVLASLTIGGCSGESDEDQIQALVDQYANALMDDDFGRACALFTPQELKEQEETLFGSCESLLELANQLIGDDRLAEAKKVEEITINGDQARIKYPNDVLPKEAKKIDGEWLFNSAE